MAQINLGPSKFGPQIIDIGTKQHGDGGEQANYDGSSLTLLGLARSNYAILSYDLDSLNVRTSRLDGVVNTHLGLALARHSVHCLAHLGNIIGIVVVLIILPLLAANTRVGYQILVTVRQFESRHGVKSTITQAGKGGAGIIGKQTQMNCPTLLSTVRPNVVLIGIATIIVIVVVGIVLELTFAIGGAIPLSALSIIHNIERVIVGLVAVTHAVSGHAALLAGVIISTVAALVVADLLVDLALILPHFFHTLEVGLEEGTHVDDVVTVAVGAADGFIVEAAVGGTETESNETLGGDADVVLAVGLVVPLGDVMAALEFDAIR